MWKYAGILILSILISTHVYAQEMMSVNQVHKETYELYQKQQWQQLILLGEKYIEQGIDFYYLRLRMGIAYYELKKYRKSAVFFQKLSQQNPEDVSLKEYLYFSYILGGRNIDAIRMQSDLPQSVKKKYSIGKTKLISGIYTETKYEFIDDYTVDSDQIQEQTVRNYFHHYSLGLNHQLGSRVSLFHAYSWVDLKNTNVLGGISFNEKVSQNQYYLKSSFRLACGTELIFGGHWLRTKLKGYPLSAETIIESAMNISKLKGASIAGNGNGGNGGNGNGNGNGNGGNGDGESGEGGNGDEGSGDGEDSVPASTVEIEPYVNTQNSYIGILGLHQDISNWKVSLGLLYFEANHLTRWQQELSVRYYPKGNLNLYLMGGFTNQMEEKLETGWLNRQYWKGGLGFRIAKNTWGQVGYSFGDMYMQVENEGYSVFNGVNHVKTKIDISCYQYVFKGKLSLFLLYQHQKEKNTYVISDILNSQHVNVQSITGGIKWKF